MSDALLKSPLEWEVVFNLQLVLPAKGWEGEDIQAPISAAEFWERANKGGWRTRVLIETIRR